MPRAKKTVPVKSGYDDSRYNAAKYGIYSSQPVLPWENLDEYEVIHDGLVEEYSPQGPTETRLVGEIVEIVQELAVRRRARNHEWETLSHCRISLLHRPALHGADQIPELLCQLHVLGIIHWAVDDHDGVVSDGLL